MLLWTALLYCYIDRWDIPSNEFQRCSWLSERWQDISMCCSLYLTLDGLFSQLQELQELPTSPHRVWSNSKIISFYLPWLLDRELSPGPGGTKLMLFHWTIHTPSVDCMLHRLLLSILFEHVPWQCLQNLLKTPSIEAFCEHEIRAYVYPREVFPNFPTIGKSA